MTQSTWDSAVGTTTSRPQILLLHTRPEAQLSGQVLGNAV